MRLTPELARLSAAAAVSADRLLQVLAQLRAQGGPTPEARLHAARHLIEMARPEEALELLDRLPGRRAEALRALAHDRRGAPGDSDVALEILTRLRASGALDGETGGLLGGRYKRRARETGDALPLWTALEVYRETWLATLDPYSGINAAALALELEGVESSRALAKDVMTALDSLSPSAVGHWTYATRAEAHLLLGNLDEARKWYRRAVAADPSAVQDIAAMRTQARYNLSCLGQRSDALDDAFPLRSVVAFIGHVMADEQPETERMPTSVEGRMRAEIRERLKTLNAGFGFSSAARGGDLLFLEEVLERGGLAQVFLPFSPDGFAATSVGDWEARFRAVLAHPRVGVRTLRDETPVADALPQAFADCNAAIRDAASRFARRLGNVPTLIAVGEAAGAKDGADDAMEAWVRAGFAREVISLNSLALADQVKTSTAGDEPAAAATRDIVRVRADTPPPNAIAYKRNCALHRHRRLHWHRVASAGQRRARRSSRRRDAARSARIPDKFLPGPRRYRRRHRVGRARRFARRRQRRRSRHRVLRRAWTHPDVGGAGARLHRAGRRRGTSAIPPDQHRQLDGLERIARVPPPPVSVRFVLFRNDGTAGRQRPAGAGSPVRAPRHHLRYRRATGPRRRGGWAFTVRRSATRSSTTRNLKHLR